ncbi:dephospho-CoA kinase [Salinarimonas ramus]|uniref:Dephospho-CoA kinase n=1 Tax=Salinarimonas ramus TaxID=690164 RepID=A0A917Q8B0_9HYPH|nr:dephospho-CoA kinase [Salinarimonas ramus]GGK34509.1 dephospho-CoA kinase [Salinarimonas ramus]
MTFVLGLTGSIGMGKSATAAMFRAAGVPVHDADATVHALYAGAAAAPIEAAFPGATRDGIVDRALLGPMVIGKPEAMARLEAIVHPLVTAEREAFLARARAAGASLAVLDVPLLFETGGERHCDAVCVVTAPADVQRARVLARPGMSPEKLDGILARQIPDAEKRRRAHFVVDTSCGFPSAERQVRDILRALAGRDGGRGA